ncbi:TSUP family transporter [Clostridium polynesiense]|uniref:TSUP family transporter n=1 Tax=Clostridium polynesiense TaxID=1325933 RepID=UPI000590099F|nr:TSUP family transporter [Clostridium polynesiense]
MTLMIFLCAAGFIAAFVDAIAGGGGLISIPAFLLAGFPPHIALGTNKFSATTGSFTSSLKFIKSKKVNMHLLKYLVPVTFIGAVLGVKTVLLIDQSFLYPVVMVLILFVGLYSLFSKNVGVLNSFTKITPKTLTLGLLLGFTIGFYDGFFGPGTGSFLIFGLIYIFKFDFVNANGNAKVLNFTSNIASLITFAIEGKIHYKYGILVGVFMVLGARMGAKIALNKGTRLIKPIFVSMSLAVAVKMLYNML